MRADKKGLLATAPGTAFRLVDDHYVGDNGVAHIYFRQTLHGIDIDNANFNVNIERSRKIFSYGSTFLSNCLPDVDSLSKSNYQDPTPALRHIIAKWDLPISMNGAWIEHIEGQKIYTLRGISGALSDPKAELVYFVISDEDIALTWKLEKNIGANWMITYVDAETNDKVYAVVDYVSHARYEVYNWGISNPNEGPRSVINDPWDISVSPFTWIGDGAMNYSTTRGNNAIAQFNPSGGDAYLDNFRPDNPDLQFEYTYSPSSSSPTSYINASITQAFYTVNAYHDLLYVLGFNEKAGNFQWNNDGKGGVGGDFVIVDTQDSYNFDLGTFTSPADGQPGRLCLGLWHNSVPDRDGSFDAGLVIHEYTHGLSHRLTGGPATPGCLNGLESGGMGEGWSDFMATAVRLKPNDTRMTDYAFAEWAENNKKGIREYLYSTSIDTNPLVYTNLNDWTEVHQIGNVWGNMLYEVLWNLIDKHGKNDGPRPLFQNGVPTDGKYLTMKLVIDGMALQPCTPNFLQARDAIIDADVALTNGSNLCEIWKAFAKRGLGQGATYSAWDRTNSFSIPSEIC
ncbi:extracellular elastinolytic metallo proteinase [Penicillium angulare]|uniref:Extracellular metalloproteinase n=1 Tax=Penicillium angulare TaxID=116970 RepID=A0A9W9K8N0_9EURO|nr:extracellular elastinolytic metallo proteinase [Penicillium angulare]